MMGEQTKTRRMRRKATATETASRMKSVRIGPYGIGIPSQKKTTYISDMPRMCVSTGAATKLQPDVK